MRTLKSRQKALAAVFAVSAAVAFAAGCGGGGSGNSSPTPTPTPTACTPIAGTFTAVNANIFQPTCAVGSSCHSGATPAGPGLDLSSYAQIMATASNHTAQETFNGSSVKLLVPGSKETSYVFLKVLGAPGITLAQMPQTGQALTACQTSALGIWIDQGLQNN